MRYLVWSLIWISISFIVSGTFSYFVGSMSPEYWGRFLEAVTVLFFASALLMGGVMTTRQKYITKQKPYYREEWAFICVLVTIGLFGIRLLIE